MKDYKPFKYIYKQRSGFCRFYLSMIILIGFSLLLPSTATAQDYGLEFFSNDAGKDERTKLDLNTEGYYSFQNEFELSFSMRLRPSLRLAFGYVARIIDSLGALYRWHRLDRRIILLQLAGEPPATSKPARRHCR